MGLQIIGLGTATPALNIPQSEAMEIARSICCSTDEQSRTLSALYRRAGVERRHSVALERREQLAGLTGRMPIEAGERASPAAIAGEQQTGSSVSQTFYYPAANADACGPTTAERMEMYERHAGQLAVDAVQQAVESSPLVADEITHLITVSCTGFSAPGIDLTLIEECGLQPTVARSQIGFMGCHGAINGMRVAKAIVEADRDARVLLCAVELCTLHQQYGWNPERIVSNALFADGAAALVAMAGQPATGDVPTVCATGSTIVPGTKEHMSWRIRDHGFEMSLSAQVPGIIESSLHAWLSPWLASHDLGVDEVRGWAIHPGGPRILTASARSLGLRAEQVDVSRMVLAEFGNMSSPTVLFILQRLLEAGDGRPCVALAFGPGLSIEAALIR